MWGDRWSGPRRGRAVGRWGGIGRRPARERAVVARPGAAGGEGGRTASWPDKWASWLARAELSEVLYHLEMQEQEKGGGESLRRRGCRQRAENF